MLLGKDELDESEPVLLGKDELDEYVAVELDESEPVLLGIAELDDDEEISLITAVLLEDEASAPVEDVTFDCDCVETIDINNKVKHKSETNFIFGFEYRQSTYTFAYGDSFIYHHIFNHE